MKKAYSELVKQIRDAVREEAQKIPTFQSTGNGCIRITAYPRCPQADDWLGGLSDFSRDTPDIVDYEHTFAITSGGNRVITVVEDGIDQKVDCYAYSAMKVAHCSLAQSMGVSLISGEDLGEPNLTEANGYGPYLGSLCVQISRNDEDISAFCDIYVCVSGASQYEDIRCSKVAISIIERFFDIETFDGGDRFIVLRPNLCP